MQHVCFGLRRVSHLKEYESRGVQYHDPCGPGAVQFNPTARPMSKLKSRAASKAWLSSDRPLKAMVESQHAMLPVPGVQMGPLLRTRVTEAVTPLTKAMAAMKEMRDLRNSTVEECMKAVVVFCGIVRNLRLELPFYKISSMPGEKLVA